MPVYHLGKDSRDHNQVADYSLCRPTFDAVPPDPNYQIGKDIILIKLGFAAL